MNLSKLAIASILMVATTPSWGATESILDLRYEEAGNNGEVKAPIQASHCAVVINAPHDLRSNKDTLGTTFRDNPIISKPPVTSWLQDALFDLKKQGLNTSLANGDTALAASNVTYLSTDLTKMYVWNHGMNLHATLVVKTRMQTGSKPEVQHNYRVISTKLNWANGDSEFITTLNIAATRLLEQIASDINKQCQATTEI